MSWSCHFCGFLSAVLIVYARVGKVKAMKVRQKRCAISMLENHSNPTGALFFTMYHASYKFMIKVEFCPKEGGKIRRNINCPDRKTKHLKGPETKCHEAINACKKRHVFSEGTLDGAAI